MVDQRRLWPFNINWGNGLAMSVEFKTEVFVARDGRETRRSGRERPRLTYEYDGLATNGRARDVNRWLDTLLDQTLIFGNPIFAVKTSTPLLAAASAFDVVSVPAWLVVDAYMVLVSKTDRYVAQVTDVTGTTVTIDTTSPVLFGAGTRLELGIEMRINADQRVRYRTSRTLTARITVRDEPGLNYVPDEGTAFDTYRSKEVLLKAPNWATPVENARQAGIDVLDYDFGRRHYDSYLDYVPAILKGDYLARDYAAVMEMLQFFIRMKGRRGEFYMPTRFNDFSATAGLTSGQNTLRVDSANYDDYDGNPAQRNIAILLSDGSWLYRQITGYADDGDESVLTVDSNWASTVALSDIVMICWLNTYRFAVDELALEWETDSVAQFTATFQLLHDLDEAL